MRVIMYATKEISFEAAHFLPFYEGKCARLHGHTYKLQVTVSRVMDYIHEMGEIHYKRFSASPETLKPEKYMVMDFTLLKDVLKEFIKPYDHSNLNNFFVTPTAEFMAAFFFKGISDELKGSGVTLESVKLWEGKNSFAECKGEFIE